jgi:hypothetical protein
MSLPGFTAEVSIRSHRSSYLRVAQMIEENIVVPSIPSTEGCQWAFDNCDDPTGKSRACKILRLCGGGRPKPTPTAGAENFVDYLLCSIGCQGDRDCVDNLC